MRTRFIEPLERRRLLASISGTVFWDHDADGTRDAGEEAMAGVTVFIDANSNGQLDPSEVRQTSGAAGDYSFEGLDAGTYRIRAVPTETHVLLTPSATSITVAAGDAANKDLAMIATSYLGTAGNDNFTVRNKNQLGETIYEVLIGNVVTYTIPANWTQGRRISFSLGDGDDTLTVDNVYGSFREVVFDGGNNATANGDLLQVVNAFSTISTQIDFTDASLPLRQFAHAISNTERVTVGVSGGALKVGVLSLPAETSMTVNGGSGVDTLIVGDDAMTPAQNSAAAVDGNITFVGGSGSDSVSYRDDADLTAGTAFNMTATSIARSGAGTVNFSGVESVAVTSGGSAQSFDISGTAAATTITTLSFFGRPAGNATFTCGPTVSTFAAPISFDVAANTLNNALVINDLGSGNDTYTISNSAISRGTFSVAFVASRPLFQQITLNGQSGDNTLNIAATPLFLGQFGINFNGNGGNDAFNTVGVIVGYNYDGGGGTNSLTVNGDANPRFIVVNANSLASTTPGIESDFANIQSIALNMQGGNDAVTLAGVPAAPLSVNMGDGNDTFTINTAPPSTLTYAGGTLASDQDTLNVNAGTFTFSQDAQAQTSNLAINVAAAGSVAFGATQHLRSLSVAGSASLSPGSAKTLVLQTLAITGAGKLDLADNDMIVRTADVGSWNGSAYTGITGLIASGYDGGVWDGAGIVTSQSTAAGGNTLTTLAAATAGDALGLSAGQTTLWNGQTVDATTVLVKYTYSGDANLDGVVSGDDYFQIDSSFPQLLHGWFNGDFNYDGVISGDDYFLIDSTFPAQGPAL
jgi:hypothetical protein